MRVIAGEYRGRSLTTPKGSNTRPTTDRVKESLMSSLASILGGFEGLCVLDAFAGSGGLGIETLSRGAAHCAFFDKDRSSIQAIGANLEALKIPKSRASVRQTDVLTSAVLAPRPFDLVFLDPPYAEPPQRIIDFVIGLASSGKLSPEAVIVYEHDSAKPLDGIIDEVRAQGTTLRILKSKTKGACAIDILDFEPGENDR